MKRQFVDKLAADGIPYSAALKAADLASSSYYYRPPAERHPGIRWGKVPGGQALHRVILWQLQDGGDLPS
jgi:hypothetical protein